MGSNPPKVNILMVDDHPNNLLALETVLQAPDRELVRASSGSEALRYLLDHDAAVILLDVHMPQIDGLETAALIRGRERSRNVPIIFLTAHDSAGSTHVARGYSLGAVDYIIKPIDPEILRSKVAVFVELYRKTEQVKRQAELLREQNLELENANLRRLSKLIDLGQRLAAQRDPARLLQIYCHAARDIIGARYAAVGMLDRDGVRLCHYLTSGPWAAAPDAGEAPRVDREFLAACFVGQRPLRLSRPGPGVPALRLLPAAALVGSFLGAPIFSLGEVIGWLCLADKLEPGEFSEADERMLVTLTQAVVFYENATLYAETRRHAAALEQEIAERRQAEEERARLLVREQAARAEAEEANRLKDEFLATISHELRTPLNAMLGWIHLLRSGMLDAATSAHAVETVERNARSQSRLVEDLLDVSRIITGKLQLKVQSVDPALIIETTLDSFRPAAEAKSIDLSLAFDPAADQFLGDPSRFQQVVWNLLSNAIKFTPAGGSVGVRLRRLGGQIELEVSDTGPGIEPDFLPHVFDRFRQADSSSSRSHGGLGLGLAIVRHLVELHGGTVRAESAGKDRGATFTVGLPLAPPRSAAAGDGGAAAPSLGLPAFASLEGLRVLVVDDDPDARQLVSAVLAQCQVEVRTAPGAAAGLVALAAWRPDVLISDIGMPDVDGYDFIRQVRALTVECGGSVPAVALTAYAGAEDRVRALAAGFQAHAPKPIEPAEIVALVASLTGRLIAAV